MIRLVKTLAFSALAAIVVAAPLATAQAGGPQGIAVPQIAVPSHPIVIPAPVPSTPNFTGSWRITQDLYGPYRMNFHLSSNGGGSYQVTGGGLYCNGGLNWYRSGNTASIQLYTSHCGSGVDWTGDRLTCQFTNYYNTNFQLTAQPQAIAVPQIAVPSPIVVPSPSQSIRCTYQPAVYGYQAISVLANRL